MMLINKLEEMKSVIVATNSCTILGDKFAKINGQIEAYITLCDDLKVVAENGVIAEEKKGLTKTFMAAHNDLVAGMNINMEMLEDNTILGVSIQENEGLTVGNEFYKEFTVNADVEKEVVVFIYTILFETNKVVFIRPKRDEVKVEEVKQATKPTIEKVTKVEDEAQVDAKDTKKETSAKK